MGGGGWDYTDKAFAESARHECFYEKHVCSIKKFTNRALLKELALRLKKGHRPKNKR